MVRLYALHHIGRQVFEGYVGIAVKEVLSVDQQIAHAIAVDRDDAAGIQFHAGQTGYQLVEHGAFGEVEGIGVVHNGVALHHHHHAGCRNGGLVQRTRRPLE